MKEECLPAKMGMSHVLWLISNFYDVQEQNFPKKKEEEKWKEGEKTQNSPCSHEFFSHIKEMYL